MKTSTLFFCAVGLLFSACTMTHSDIVKKDRKEPGFVTPTAGGTEKVFGTSCKVEKYDGAIRQHIYDNNCIQKEFYISNHDQTNPKRVALVLDGVKNKVLDFGGQDWICHGRLIPIIMTNCENVKIKNLSIDFEYPQIRQLNVMNVNKEKGYFECTLTPKGNYSVRKNRLFTKENGTEASFSVAMPFRADKRLAYRRADLGFGPSKIEELGPDSLRVYGFQVNQTEPGEHFALRTYFRPCPGIVIDGCKNIELENVKVHYSEGMALIVQMTENITLRKFGVCLRGENDPRCFTSQADATHFSGCKGKITSVDGLYEGMADDAINVHGTYLRVTKRVNDTTLVGRYMHGQAWGFNWGFVGDEVQFVASKTMELVDGKAKIKSIRALDKKTAFGAREFEIVFDRKIPAEVVGGNTHGIENLEWTPEVEFSRNIVRNNRARGALFSTPKKVVCEDNLFDHTHGTAILLCGDCNGWYETGACTDVLIRNNTFINALTANYQFTEAIISIYPEIPDLKKQKKYFHRNVRIENNTFKTFDNPIVYAKSIDGLTFKNNTIEKTNDFQPFHNNKFPFFFEHVKNVDIKGNTFKDGMPPFDKAIRLNLTDKTEINYQK